MGRVLFDTWFAPVWDTLGPRVRSGQHSLLIQSAEPAVLNLPWELVELGDGLPLGCDAGWSLRRTSLPALAFNTSFDPGPLRIVFLASAPLDLAQLDFEREEDAMLRATSRLGEDVVVYISDTGTFDELADLVASIRPHIVHLSGHGSVDASGRGAFAFENERGHMDARDAADLATQIFRGSSVRCVVLNACETSQAAASGLCQTLTVSGVPHAIGWAAPVADDRATEFTEALYRRLAHGEPLPQAVAHARDTARRSGALRHGGVEVQDATFALAQMYCSDDGAELYDRAASRRPWQGPQIVHELLGDGIKGLREGFVGRRRDVQRLVPPLRDGDVTFAVITGIGGAGKSTLATRAANRLAAAGFEVRPVRAAEGPSAPERARLTLSKVISSLSDAFLKAGREDLHRLLTSGEIALDQRLRLAVDGLNELRLLIVLDNFEDCLDLDSRRIADPDLAECYRLLATRLTRGSRVIVTCRYFPEDTPGDQPLVEHVPLHDLDEPATLKFLRRDHVVESRLAKGELPWELIRNLHRALGGTPGFLVEVRRILESADADDLMAELHGVSAGPIAPSRDAYFHRIVLQRLWDACSPGARDLASRLALSELPLPPDAVAGFAHESETALAECSRYGLVSELPDTNLPTLYAVPGLLRPWMTAPERLDAQAARATHRYLAHFWKTCFESDRGRQLRADVDTELSACREHSRLGDDPDTFQSATVRLARGLERRAEWRLAYTLLHEIPDSDRDADTLATLGSLEMSFANYAAARANFERVLALRQAIGNRAGETATWHQLATIDLREGNYPAARANFESALAMRQAIGDYAGEAATWHQLAAIDAHENYYPAARQKFERVLAMWQAIGDRAGEAVTWHNLASIDLREAHYAAAREKFERALAMRRAIGDRAGEAATWHQLATIDVYEGHYPAARASFEKALAIEQAIGDRAGEATTRHNLGSIDLNEGHYPAARANVKKSLAINQAIGNRAGEAGSWHQLATIDVHEGHYPAARVNFEKSLAINQAIGGRAGEAATWHSLASVDLREGHYPAARANFERALTMHQEIGDRAGEAATWHNLASLDLDEGHYPAARANFERALTMRQAIGDRAGEAATWHNLASIDLDEGHYPAARANFERALTMHQEIGDRAAEAATFFQLGMLADRLGRTEGGARLVALCWMIDRTIGHGDADSDFQSLAGLCTKAALDPTQFDQLLAEVAEAYDADRGRSLIERAFELAA
ncbi:MAG TPA: tetratricopeptide repeat protein [Candidatus Acidoferrum sp.]|nr:tetratricopeptide repeat protein [Candidatus Acidoferrum sp.]